MTRILVVFGAAAVSLAGCGTEPQTRISADFGEAIQHNMAAHIINPAPVQAAPTDLDGRRARVAVERYLKGQVKEVAAPTTSQVGGGS